MSKPSPCACTNLRRAARAITEFYDRNLEPAGLKVTQFSLLRSVLRAGPTSISALAEEVHLDRTTLGRNLAVLEREGLVALSPGRDQRERTVTLTHSGKRALDSAIPLWEQAQYKVMKALGRSGLDGLTSLLVKLEAFA
ncbi:MAG TPA: MarR family transcriptional regulator [Acidiferrobacterales bacterium]|nr:MarR family transcriptional regulator [Acidiferrobacterales bacterium]